MKKHDMQIRKYSCPKCGSRMHEVGEMYASGGFWQKIFDLDNRKFTTVTCKKCRYTELFAVPAKKLGTVLDFFVS